MEDEDRGREEGEKSQKEEGKRRKQKMGKGEKEAGRERNHNSTVSCFCAEHFT